MNITCSLCKNKNDFRYFVKYFKESFEDIRKNDLLKDPTKFSYAHLICSSFFTQLELVILKESMQANGPASENSNILPSAVICNGKDLKERVIDDCSVCNLPINKYILIPCAAKGCSTYFHYHCTKNKKDLARIKLVKSDGTTFKYGFFCAKHNKLLTQNNPVPLRYENFSLFKVLEEFMFETDLQLQEMVFLERNSIIEIEKDIEKTMQSFAAQLNQNSEEKNKRAQIEHKNNSHKHHNQAPSQPQKSTPSVENNANNNGSKFTLEYDTFGDFLDIVSDDEESTNIKPKTFDENIYVALSSQIKENGMDIEDNKSEKPDKLQRDSEKSKRDRGKGVLKDLEDIYSKVDKKEDLEGSTENGDDDDLNPSDKAIKNIISARQKKAAEGNYNLRGEIKSNSKLNFDKNVFDYQSAPRKHQKEKQLHVSEPPRSSEEKKRWYWNEVNEGYFRKPHADEYDLLSTTKIPNIKDVFRSELFRNLSTPNEDVKHTFHPTFDLHELRTFTKPYYNTNFDTKDSLKVLFEFKDAGIWKSPMMCYFRMKKKAQTELDLPENLDSINEESNPKYVAIASHKNKELKSIFNESLKTLGNKPGYRFMEDPIDEEELSHQKFYTLFGLKHVDYLTNEESQELKTRAMMEEELQEILEARENKEIDEITREMISYSYLLYQFVVPENNARKERTMAKVKEEEFIQHGQVKLQEKSKKLESELKFILVKKYFHYGFRDKTQSMLDMLEEKNENKFGAYQPNGVNVSGFETDCCVCFHNQSLETNPIMYCSGCDSAFHQNCYGIPSIPSGDFYCDVCLFTNVNKKKSGGHGKRKHAQRMKVADRKIPSDVYCRICMINDFPLRKMKRNEWFHITCLILHDMVYHKNGEFSIKSEKAMPPYYNPNQECSICKNKYGLYAKCAEKSCKKYFHCLCAYLEGYEFHIQDSKDNKDDKTRNGLDPKIYCPDHQLDKERDAFQQKYFRRYTTNYKNTGAYKTFEDYVKYYNQDQENDDTQPTGITELNYAEASDKPVNSKREAELYPDEIDSQVSGTPSKKSKSE